MRWPYVHNHFGLLLELLVLRRHVSLRKKIGFASNDSLIKKEKTRLSQKASNSTEGQGNPLAAGRAQPTKGLRSGPRWGTVDHGLCHGHGTCTQQENGAPWGECTLHLPVPIAAGVKKIQV